MLIELTCLDGKKTAINVYQIALIFETKKGVKVVFCDGFEQAFRESLSEICSLVNARSRFLGPEYAVLKGSTDFLEKGEKSEETM